MMSTGTHRVGSILVHRTSTVIALIEMPDEPGHQQLCDAEQAYLARRHRQ